MNLPEDTRALIDAFLGGCATPEQHAQLDRLLAADPDARATFCDAVEADVLLAAWAANRKEADAAQSVLQDLDRGTTLARSASEGVDRKSPQGDSPTFAPQTNITVGSQKLGQSPFGTRRALTLAVAAAVLIVVGVLAYTFSTRPGPATLVRTTDAQWSGAPARDGDGLTPGQRLALTRGTAEIAFSGQAKVLLSAPVELEIVDAGACRLASGKLTAHVPEPARGFKVHTPDGTVTDLGTDFGVLVSLAGAAANTEVHVFRGEVEVATRAGAATTTAPAFQPRKLTTGQAAILTAQLFKLLPAADPFRFAPDQLTGQPRQVLVAEDFEVMHAGADGPRLGAWKTAYSSGQGRRVWVVDPADPAADKIVDPLPPVGHSAVEFQCSQRIAKSLYPLLSHDMDVKFPARCQVLVECDICPRTPWVEPSLMYLATVRLATGVTLTILPDPKAPQLIWEKYRWYRTRVLFDVVDSRLQAAHIERFAWRGAQGWVADLPLTPLTVPADLAKQAIASDSQLNFGFPGSVARGSGGTYWLDNIRVELLAND